MANAVVAQTPSTIAQIHMALPKGHMQENVFKLFEEAGLKVQMGHTRGYRPTVPLPNYDVKLLKPQNILGMLASGVRDVGFAGGDWVEELELGADVVMVLDTEMDPVRIVAAAPTARTAARERLHVRNVAALLQQCAIHADIFACMHMSDARAGLRHVVDMKHSGKLVLLPDEDLARLEEVRGRLARGSIMAVRPTFIRIPGEK